MKAITLILLFSFQAISMPLDRSQVKANCEAHMELPKEKRDFDCLVVDDQNMIIWLKNKEIKGKQKAAIFYFMNAWGNSRTQNETVTLYLDRTFFKPSKTSVQVCFSRWNNLYQTAEKANCYDSGDAKEAMQIRRLWWTKCNQQ